MINDISKLYCKVPNAYFISKKLGLDIYFVKNFIKNNINYLYSLRDRYCRMICHISHVNKIDLKEISKITGVNIHKLYKVSKKYNIKRFIKNRKNKKINENIKDLFIKDYLCGLSARKIANKYGFKSTRTVFDVLHGKNINIRRKGKITSYKEDFFEKINSIEKSYILGLIMSDGWIMGDYNGVAISLCEEDKYILEKISTAIGATHGVKKVKFNRDNINLKNKKDMYILTINNKKISNDLRKLGVVKNKSKILRYNNCVPEKFLSHFFRGLFDGDGSIGIQNAKTYPSLFGSLISCSHLFIEDLTKIHLPFKYSIGEWKYKNSFSENPSTMKTLRIVGSFIDKKNFLKWLYKDKGDWYLDRKFSKIKKVFELENLKYHKEYK